jgi:isopentenyl-diphosphate delta-isomerase
MNHSFETKNQQRKEEHLRICLTEDVEFHLCHTGFNELSFVHNSLPEIDRNQVSLETEFLGKNFRLPLMFSCMTGGTEEARRINQILASVAQEAGIGMGVGSQRVALENPSLADTYQVRNVAPDIFLVANLGAVQLNKGVTYDDCLRAVDMIQADALALHLNPLQECIQVGGDTDFSGLLQRIERLCRSFPVPVIIKEVGHGISAKIACQLWEAGVSAIDVAGAGGTSWAKVESIRQANISSYELGDSFNEWGIPTTRCLEEIHQIAPDIRLIGSGGVRSGVDVAKTLALGAKLSAIGLPFLRDAAQSTLTVEKRLQMIRHQLETVLFCVGAKKPAELSEKGLLVRNCPQCGYQSLVKSTRKTNYSLIDSI